MKCTKVYFADEKQALFYIDKLKKTSVRDRTPQQAYLCPICFNWHLTSQPSPQNKQIIYMQRQIDNLKAKLLHIEKERDTFKEKLARFAILQNDEFLRQLEKTNPQKQ